MMGKLAQIGSALKGRGALSNPPSRYAATHVALEEPLAPDPRRHVKCEVVRSIVSTNNSPDIPFDQSINPYRGCEHGCIYCYARPTHAWLDLSPGLDFETRLYAKPNAAQRLRETLARPGYRCRLIAIGANTDPYQPIEREHRITRQLLEVCLEVKQPVQLITKSTLVLRDTDLLAAMAEQQLASVAVSVTTLERDLKRVMEPRAASPEARLATIRGLRAAGVPVSVLVAPVIPRINDHELERILAAVTDAGAQAASYVLLRLPLEVRDLFVEWLEQHFPERAGAVMALVRDSRGGRDYDSSYGQRMRGQGQYAELIRARFEAARRRHGLDQPLPELDTTRFRPPAGPSPQLSLF